MKTPNLLLTAAVAALAMAAPAQRHTPAERYQMFQDYLVRRAAEVTKNNLAGVTDFAGWKRKRPEVRKRFLYLLGLDPMPARTPLNARVTGGLAQADDRVGN